MKSFCTIILFLTIFFCTKAQDYKNSIRLSCGDYWGVNYIRMFSQEKGVMGSFQFNKQGYQLTGLKIFHTPAFPLKSSQWFMAYGYGAHFAYHNRIETSNVFTPFAPAIVNEGNYFSPGFDGYISIEYRFLKYPFTLSADYLPGFEFFGPGFFRLNANNFSICAAFTF